MTTMVASKYALFDLELVIVEELFEKARFGIFVELRADEASRTITRASLARSINLDLLFRRFMHPLMISALNTL